MAELGATEFKAKCLELMDRVASRRETFVITKRGRPVAKLVPIENAPRRSILGCMVGKVAIRGDIISPLLPSGTWDALGEWDDLAEKTRKRQTTKPSANRRQR
jgi:prevent-host-death family protein